MADVRDQYGNPIQLTDEYGNPVQLTDEYGNPMHLSGIATTKTTTVETPAVYAGAGSAQLHGGAPTSGVLPQHGVEHRGQTGEHGGNLGTQIGAERAKEKDELDRGGEIQRSSSSSSGSSEDDGQGGRRKKKGLKDKIKEKFSGGSKNKDDHHTAQTKTVTATTTTTTGTGVSGQHQEHEKKSVMEKIKEKLPGHHTH
ncbi:hypothetical protein ACOSP7_005586 [Xanthoceras sorbifolium]